MTSQAETVTYRVVQSVADAAGVDPLDLPPLYDAIDPDTLAAMTDETEVGITFQYAGHAVEVRSDGSVTVTDGFPGGESANSAAD